MKQVIFADISHRIIITLAAKQMLYTCLNEHIVSTKYAATHYKSENQSKRHKYIRDAGKNPEATPNGTDKTHCD